MEIMSTWSKLLTSISETISKSCEDISIALDSMGPADWATFIVAGILEIAFVATIIMLVSAN